MSRRECPHVRGEVPPPRRPRAGGHAQQVPILVAPETVVQIVERREERPILCTFELGGEDRIVNSREGLRGPTVILGPTVDQPAVGVDISTIFKGKEENKKYFRSLLRT